MTERIARHRLAGGLHLADDAVHAGTLGDEQVDAADPVHHRAQSPSLPCNIQREFREIHAVDLVTCAGQTQFRQKRARIESLPVFASRRRGKPPRSTPHDFVDDQHPGIGAVLGDHVMEEDGALLCRRPRSEALPDRIDIVVDGLG